MINSGQRFGSLLTLKPERTLEGKNGWLCQCDCGNLKVIRTYDLEHKRSTSCGFKCPLRYLHSKSQIDEAGNRYGRLTVLYRLPPKQKGRIIWHCKCDCGNETDVRGSDLRSKKVLSCGCLKREKNSELQFKNEIGNRYGKLTVVSLITKSPKAIWKCKCDCGNYKEVLGIRLRNGNVKSCGCLLSWPEEEINQFLKFKKVNFKRQYTFSDLYGDNDKLRFDFAIFKGDKLMGLIEYMGDQHYKAIEYWGGEKSFSLRQKYDKLKEEYCQKNKIPLLLLNKEKETDKEIREFLNKIFGELWEDFELES